MTADLRPSCHHPERPERGRIALAVSLAALHCNTVHARHEVAEDAPSDAELHHWYAAALEMRALAESRGDQPYGAVLVLDGRIVGYGPSRVVANSDPTAHAEREAIRDAQRKLGRHVIARTILVSTARPCAACESAAAQAGVTRMLFGASLTDAGPPARKRTGPP